MKKKKKIEIVKPLTRFFGLWLLCKKSCWQDWALEGWMLKMRFWTQNKISNFSYLYFSLIFEQISGTPDICHSHSLIAEISPIGGRWKLYKYYGRNFLFIIDDK